MGAEPIRERRGGKQKFALQCDPEKIAEDVPINLFLHLWQPAHLEIRGINPLYGPKFRVFDIYRRLAIDMGCYEKIILFLAVAAPFQAGIGKQVTVWSTRFRSCVGSRLDAELLPQLPMERLKQRLAFIDAALGKLPGIGDVGAFADKDATICPLQNRGYIWAIDDVIHFRAMAFFTLSITRWARRLIIFAVVFAVAFLWQHWQPARQVALHQQHLVEAVENKNVKRIRALLADDYSDRFGHTQETVASDLREVIQQFLVLTLHPQGERMDFQDETRAVITTNLTISGNGFGAADMISREVNSLSSPWVFHWRRQSWLPWDWKLQSVDNASLKLPTLF